MRKLDYVDSLRGLAILGVIVMHVSLYGNYKIPDDINKILNYGARGVQLFYLASAFTIFLSLKSRIKESSLIKKFFLRRFFRIAPLYYIGICYYLIQDGFGPRYWLGDVKKISLLNILSNFTFLHGINPYWINSIVPGGWSIGVEAMFYAVAPFLFFKIKNASAALNLFIASLLIRTIFNYFFLKFDIPGSESLWNEFIFFYFPNQFPIFCLGIVMYYLIIEPYDFNQISGKVFIIFALYILIGLVTDVKLVSPIIIPEHILFGIGFLFFSIGLSKYNSLLFVNPVITYIGKISFGMYLTHFAVLYWLQKLNLIDFFQNRAIFNYGLRLLLVIFISVIISTLLHKFIELPFQQFGKKLIKRLENNNRNIAPTIA